MLHTAGEVAKIQRGKGLNRNDRESIAWRAAETLKFAREGKTFEELMRPGTPFSGLIQLRA